MSFALFIAIPNRLSKPEIIDSDGTSVTITWTKPDSDDRIPITGYVVEYKEKSSSDWITVNINGSDQCGDTSLTVPDLMENKDYQFRIAAENENGRGSFSQESDICKTLGKEFFAFDEIYPVVQLE